MVIEKTLFFIKPYIDFKKAEEIIEYGHSLLTGRGWLFRAVEQFRTSPQTLEFYLDFYSQIGEKYPEVLQTMASDFASCPRGLVGEVLEGKEIIERVRSVLGPSRIVEENLEWTIRGQYGHYKQDGKLHRTVAHCSTKDEVKKDFRIFKRANIISKLHRIV